MKKIIFETMGNLIFISLFAAVIIEVFVTNVKYTNEGVQFTTGTISIIFFIYLIVFLTSRWILSKKDKSYSLKQGEFSASDEREKNNAYFASIISYKSTIISLFIALGIFVFINTLLNPPFNTDLNLFISGVVLFTLVICTSFLSYAIAWIFQDTR
ncbi:hypothetical protein [Carnobacterium jeotgali]